MLPGSRRSRVALWSAFAAVHAWLTWLGVVVAPTAAFADLDLYRWWMHLGLDWSTWPVLDAPWVYPAGAIGPMVLPALGSTTSTAGYALGWCFLVTALDAAAMITLLSRGDPDERRSPAGAWWWLGYLLLLGPVAIGRLDGVVTPVMMIALVVALRRPAVASVLLTVGAWIKVAPGALLLPLVLAVRRPLRQVVVPAAATCLVVVGLVTAGGGAGNIASFVGTQSTRGLQAEAVAATPWMVSRLWRGDVSAELNTELITWEVHGPGTGGTVWVVDALMLLAVSAIAAMMWFARLEGRGRRALLPGALLLVVVLIVLNKVGSPQFLAWLAAPIATALCRPDASPRRRRRAVAGTALVAALLTQVVFPWGYTDLIVGEAGMTLALAARNVLLVVLLGLAVSGLVASATDEPTDEPDEPTDDASPASPSPSPAQES